MPTCKCSHERDKQHTAEGACGVLVRRGDELPGTEKPCWCRGYAEGPITILDVAYARGVVEQDGAVSRSEFHRVGLAFMGGCATCHATLGAYNAFPSKGGFWKCEDCLGDDGFDTVEAFETSLKKTEAAPRALTVGKLLDVVTRAERTLSGLMFDEQEPRTLLADLQMIRDLAIDVVGSSHMGTAAETVILEAPCEYCGEVHNEEHACESRRWGYDGRLSDAEAR